MTRIGRGIINGRHRGARLPRSQLSKTLLDRLMELANVLGPQAEAGSGNTRSLLASLVDPLDRTQIWLAITMLTRQFPNEATVIRVSREGELDPERLEEVISALVPPGSEDRTLRVASRTVLVDVHNTVHTHSTTGIHRVVRETVRRWVAERDITLVAWTPGFKAMRGLTRQEASGFGITDPLLPDDQSLTDLIVPWNSTVVTPEFESELDRTDPMRALCVFSQNAVGYVCYDLVPVFASETMSPEMPGIFARHLTVLRHSRRIATASHSVALEYEGWKSGLRAIGLAGPTVVAVPLPLQAVEVSADAIRETELALRVGSLPLVLVVGSHEPRKNHLPILESAERLWREGQHFCLTFIGRQSLGGAEFAARSAELADAGRPIQIVTDAPDDLVWAGYRIARFTIFPSLYEGFGIPVAESITVGTPCITSNYGSMKEIGEGGGALLVDSHSDAEIHDAMLRLLTDDGLLRRLQAEARGRPPRTWDDYAWELWDKLVVPLRVESA